MYQAIEYSKKIPTISLLLIKKESRNVSNGFPIGILKIRFLGECAHCELSHITLKYAIEKTIVEKIPEVNKVIEVKMSVV